MSKINDLIKELCPNGVQYKNYGDVFEIKTGKGITTKDASNDGLYPIISGGTTPMGYYNQYNRNENTVTVSRVGANAGFVSFIKEKFYLNDKCFSIVPVTNYVNRLLPKFVFHYTKNIEKDIMKLQSEGGVPTINTRKVSNLLIPILPIEVQEEIVLILDKFGSLEAELEAELEARKCQYEFWREKIINMYESKNVKLSDMAKVYDGTHSTPNYQLSGVPFISVENISNIYGSNKFISEEDYQKYKIKPEINDVFMTRIGTIGKCSVFDKQIDLAYYVSLALIRPNTEIILPKYLKYVIGSNIGKDELHKKTLVHAVPIKVNKDEIGKIVLPVPSIENQKTIIAMLDKFELLTESISYGLPTEIELRRKQYEFYRNKLLSFEEV